ncbi:MAG: RIO1 family regulatory kinase/ATPase [Candidatus Diapherotrites archaeon]|nr:RIO1 family regulatory kinase/ATPase [Candidatus Diapherotrites archaeon]MDZ4256414.1 RIO1 family regulatory kinase/ATPase [archaeon]
MIFQPTLNIAQEAWLAEKGGTQFLFHARGKSAGIWRVQVDNHFLAAKAEHALSTRPRMVEREAENLRAANAKGIGPRLRAHDPSSRILLMEWVDGIPLGEWLDRDAPEWEWHPVLRDLFTQAHQLDTMGLDHGQLGGKLHNILIRPDGRPCILDFEKAVWKERPHNVSKLHHVLLSGKTQYSLRVRERLGIV